MSKKMAELTMLLECGGRIVTYIPCDSEKHLKKKLDKLYKKGRADFGHFRVNDSAVIFASYDIKDVH